MAVEGSGGDLAHVVVLLGAGVIAVPIFKRLGLGTVLGYFTAGLIIGPFGLGFFSDPETILHVAELGVVMFLFIIGLEMQPSRLWSLRREIFGLGLSQVFLCMALLSVVGVWLLGLEPIVAFIASSGFVLSSTAVVMQMLDERGETSTAPGQQAVSILLLEDLMIVPLLAIVALMAPGESESAGARAMQIVIALGSLAALVAAGRWLLNPMFRVLASVEAREVMTAAALLVVLGSALLMDVGGWSMAMGAFLAGVLLSESTFRHQLEADVEPFRGILLGLFFLAVGMSLDLAVIAAQWPLIALAVIAFMVTKGVGIYLVARLFGSGHPVAVTRVALFAQGGEFAFVLYAAAASAGLFNVEANAIFSATVIISMALTPLIAIVMQQFMPRTPQSMDGIDAADGLEGNVLIIGFGRFAQVASQGLLARGFDVSIIENDVEMIRAASDFGFKVYFGDGRRLDILHASGAAEAQAILVCVDDRDAADRIVDLVKTEFPLTKLFVRAFDRGHALDLIEKGVDYQIRETFESAMAFGHAAMIGLGVPADDAQAITDDVRKRDQERLELQIVGDLYSGRDLMRRNVPSPTPLTTPRREGRVYGQENADADTAERVE
ncbi:monovalent cation:proton antiporter-2 (CPA2) family protein [Pararhizobium haloflavum]|uniref:monovalent cation:proton antiporter-2 (CPA2) family protein n=1 Tax=Pararhizobium haloflavum TaxID=2037914 RepID=UPI000C187DB6|nr:monovalent cation:proton antiporter-2 (CPA2) family protein [Pararhizobium haloflavum]